MTSAVDVMGITSHALNPTQGGSHGLLTRTLVFGDRTVREMNAICLVFLSPVHLTRSTY